MRKYTLISFLTAILLLQSGCSMDTNTVQETETTPTDRTESQTEEKDFLEMRLEIYDSTPEMDV